VSQQILAMGGGGFSMEPDNLALDRFLLSLARRRSPRVCFLPPDGSDQYIRRFYDAFTSLDSRPRHLSLFRPPTADIEGFLCDQDIIYVGGGNTRSMLAVWHEWGLPDILRTALDDGVVLGGVSAGAICWFDQGLTDSVPGKLLPLKCLGFLPGSCTPHAAATSARAQAYRDLVIEGSLPGGYIVDDSAALHFVDGDLARVVCSREGVGASRVEAGSGWLEEDTLPTERVYA